MAPTAGRGHLHIIWYNICRKLHENEQYWPEGGTPLMLLDPPLVKVMVTWFAVDISLALISYVTNNTAYLGCHSQQECRAYFPSG